MANPNQSLTSGEPGTSGRELFEGSTATGHGEKQPTFGTGYKEGTEAGDKGNHGEHDHDLGAGPHRRGGSHNQQQTGGLSGAGAGLSSGGNHGSTGAVGGNHGNTGPTGANSGATGLTGGNHGSTGLTGASHGHSSDSHSHSTSSHGVTGGHSGSGTGDLSGRPADISSALKVPHEEHALHGAGIQSIGGAAIGGNHNPRSLGQEGLQGQTVGSGAGHSAGTGVGHSTTSQGATGQGMSQATRGTTQGQQADSGRHGLTNQFDHSEDKLLSGARHEADLPTHGQINTDSMNPANLFNKAAGKADQKAEQNDVKGGSTAQDKAERAANQRNL